MGMISKQEVTSPKTHERKSGQPKLQGACAKEISVDPSVVAFSLELGGIFTVKEHKNHN